LVPIDYAREESWIVTAYLSTEPRREISSLSESRFAGRSWFLEGPEGREPLGASYDEDADVLYLWRGDQPAEAISFPTDDGILVRVNTLTGDLVGVTLLDFDVFWADKERIESLSPRPARRSAKCRIRPRQRIVS
jgi:hypothetical protein